MRFSLIPLMGQSPRKYYIPRPMTPVDVKEAVVISNGLHRCCYIIGFGFLVVMDLYYLTIVLICLIRYAAQHISILSDVLCSFYFSIVNYQIIPLSEVFHN